MLKKEQFKEFEKVVKPVMKWLNENCHPHVEITIESTRAELKEGTAAIKTLEFVTD